MKKPISIGNIYKPAGHTMPTLPEDDLGNKYFPKGCPFCGSKVEFTDSSRYYGVNRGMIYICNNRQCNASVAAHMTNDRNYAPMGKLALAKIRYMRRELHVVFDKIWKKIATEENMSFPDARNIAYGWLSNSLKIKDAHISELSERQCKKATSYCKELLSDGDLLYKVRAGKRDTVTGDKGNANAFRGAPAEDV